MKNVFVLFITLIALLGCSGNSGNSSGGDKHQGNGGDKPDQIVEYQAVSQELLKLGELASWQKIAYVMQRSSSAESKESLHALVQVLDLHLIVICHEECLIRKGDGL